MSARWEGAWADNSGEWDEFPEIAEALEHTQDADDGLFFMEDVRAQLDPATTP